MVQTVKKLSRQRSDKGSRIYRPETNGFDFRKAKLCKYINSKKNERVLSNQLLRSGTSIGANVFEAEKGQTKADFYAKMTIALKEANETYYWLKLMFETDYLSREEFESIEKDIKEICSILVSITKTTKESLNDKK